MEDKQYTIPWDESLNTGIHWIDDQHKKLLKQIETILNAIVAGMGHSEVDNTLKFMEDYAHTHFSTEEKYMRQYNYPEYDLHEKGHRQFLTLFSDIYIDFDLAGATKSLAFKIETELWSWFKNHESETDRKFVKFLKDEKVPIEEMHPEV